LIFFEKNQRKGFCFAILFVFDCILFTANVTPQVLNPSQNHSDFNAGIVAIEWINTTIVENLPSKNTLSAKLLLAFTNSPTEVIPIHIEYSLLNKMNVINGLKS